jgi:hypothetical protein
LPKAFQTSDETCGASKKLSDDQKLLKHFRSLSESIEAYPVGAESMKMSDIRCRREEGSQEAV